jgi:multiple sugar transport system permease protein
MRRGEKAVYYIAPAIIFLVAMSIFPLLYSLVTSFQEMDLAGRFPTRFVGLKNYIQILHDGRFLNSLKVTFLYTTIAVGLEIVLGFILALLLWHEFRGSRVIISLMTLPIMLTPVVSAMMWRMLFHADFGVLNFILGKLFNTSQPIQWIAETRYALASIIIVDVWQWTPFAFLIFLSGLRALPKDCIEAAKIDGASGFLIVKSVILPLLERVVLVAVLIRTIDSIKVFDYIYVLTMGGPGSSTESLSLYTYLTGYRYLNMGYASSLSYVVLIIINVLSMLFIRSLLRYQKGG